MVQHGLPDVEHLALGCINVAWLPELGQRGLNALSGLLGSFRWAQLSPDWDHSPERGGLRIWQLDGSYC